MKDDIEISWIDNDCLYPNVEYSSAFYDDDGTLSKTIKCNEYLSVISHGNNSNLIFSESIHDVIEYIINNIPNVASNIEFQKYYNLIMPNTDERKILKSCYGILMNLRNWETHHIYSSKNSNNDYGFSYEKSDGKEDSFFIHLPPKGIILLKEILTAIVKQGCGIATEGHYLDFLSFHYNMLYNYKKNYGCYKSSRTELLEINKRAKLKWPQRCIVLNPTIEYTESHIIIKNIIPLNDVLDFWVELDGEKYIIPQEVLHNRSIRLSRLSKWKAIANLSHGIRL